jgi:predicted nucleic acid-binding protein
MILVDTGVWIDHLRSAQAGLVKALNTSNVACHPFVVGELALGLIRNRGAVLASLRRMPMAPAATDEEVSVMIERRRLWGLGIGYVDAHLLASASLEAGLKLWTRDARLRAAADQLGLAHVE